MSNKHILVAAGTRPNFMKTAPVLRALDASSTLEYTFLHTGQHYDAAMSDVFFKDLGMPEPDIHFNLQRTSHSGKIAEIMQQTNQVFSQKTYDMVLVFGDVNSTLTTAITASKFGVPVAHVEAGLRSFDRRMPEELNRIITDHISDLLFTTEESGNKHLNDEGCDANKIHFVGNVMIDTLVHLLPRIQKRATELYPNPDHMVVTLHRQENVDDKKILTHLIQTLHEVAKTENLLWPIHPRTKNMIEEFNLNHYLENMQIVVPMGYIDFMATVSTAKAIITDSGGIQEETTYLGIPCATLRDSTERPSTIEQGTNTLLKPGEVELETLQQACQLKPNASIPELWDGQAAERIVKVLEEL